MKKEEEEARAKGKKEKVEENKDGNGECGSMRGKS